MDFELSDDERDLVEAMRRLCAGRFPMDQVRAGEGRRALDLDGWSALAEAGVFSLRQEGGEGAGLGMVDAALVFEELGRALVPGPLVATEVAAGLVKGASSGQAVVGLVSRPGPGDDALPVLVADLASLSALLVVDGARVYLLSPDALDAEPIEHGLDPLTPMWRLHGLPDGEVVGDGTVARKLWREHLVLTAALLVGMAGATCDMAVEYAKMRRQFGVAIGTFQAVKHLCADMLVRTETARAAVHAAAVIGDQPEAGDEVRAAAGAALLATQAALANAKTGIQVHGGMGFTWEVPAHLYLKRAALLSQSLDRPGVLAGAVAERF